MNIINLSLQFLVSGSVVVGASLLAKHIDPKWAGLLVALPIMTILSLFFISANNNSLTTQKYLLSSLIFMIPAAVYIASVYLSMAKFSLGIAIILSIIPFVITLLIVQKAV